MKKIVIKLVSAVLALSMLSSCGIAGTRKKGDDAWEVNSIDSQFTPKQFDDLSKQKEDEISACVKKDGYEYQSGQYFGTYNQYDVVLISQINGTEYRDAKIKKIAGYGHYIGDTEKLIAYKDNSYMLLSKAYSKGIITKPDIKNAMYLYEEYYFAIADERIILIMKKDDNNPSKKYTEDDFPTINIEKIIQYSWVSSDEGQRITVVLSTKNRRNVLNAIRELKKLDKVLSAEPSGLGYFN